MSRGPAPQPIVAVGAIVFDDAGRVLLIERGRPPGVGLWSVPGGRVELGEPLVEVVERVTPGDGGTYHYVILDYLAWSTGGTPTAGDDARAARFVAIDELAQLPLTDGLRPVLERARALADRDPPRP